MFNYFGRALFVLAAFASLFVAVAFGLYPLLVLTAFFVWCAHRSGAKK